ncbi:hypothetical protein [Gemmobacter denitrificans]|uniref:Asparagine synthase n=1 Tax=Gemmobacter denitrificans TaxID=3123040 RepID=A0ABU8C0A4_9RHOB
MLITSSTDLSKLQDTLIGVAHSEECSIFGQAGLEEFLRKHSLGEFSPIYGNYILLRKDAQGTDIETDHFGLSKVYCYKGVSSWAISDSIAKLTDFAKMNGERLTPYRPAAYAFQMKTGIGQQLSSFRTAVAEITLVPHWFNLRVDQSGLSLHRKAHPNWSPDLDASIDSAKRFFGSLVRSYLDRGFNPIILLSAGLDSRCTAAVLSSSLSSDQSSKIESVSMKGAAFAAERELAEQLASKFNFSQRSGIPMERRPSWSDWRVAFLGAYSVFDVFPRFSLPTVLFGGSCAENVKPFYDWGGQLAGIPFPDIIPDDMKSEIYGDIQSALDEFQRVETVALTPEQRHYQAFRNRFHFGKDVRETIFNFPPLVYSMLHAKDQAADLSAFHRIIFQSASEDVFEHPFDSVEKSFNRKIPDEWVSGRGRKIDTVQREIFVGQYPAARFDNLSGTESHMAEEPARTVGFLSPDFFVEFDAAFEYVKKEDLLDGRVVRNAFTQINWLKQSPPYNFPGILPDLMAVLSIGMANANR